MRGDLVYLDLETTGLDPARHQAWEAAWAVDDRRARSTFLGHSRVSADPESLRLNGYHRRYSPSLVDHGREQELFDALAGSTIVGANPAFDAAFLRARWGGAHWHHRLLDVEALAMPALGGDAPRGLHDIAGELRALGHPVPEPDHTAEGDVMTTREAHRALRRIAAARGAAS